MLVRLWGWITNRLMGSEWIGSYGDFTVIRDIQDHDTELVEVYDIPAFEKPVDRLDELDDAVGRVFVWDVDTEERRQRFLKTLTSYQEQYGEFDAMHVVVTDKEELHMLNADELGVYVDE